MSPSRVQFQHLSSHIWCSWSCDKYPVPTSARWEVKLLKMKQSAPQWRASFLLCGRHMWFSEEEIKLFANTLHLTHSALLSRCYRYISTQTQEQCSREPKPQSDRVFYFVLLICMQMDAFPDQRTTDSPFLWRPVMCRWYLVTICIYMQLPYARWYTVVYAWSCTDVTCLSLHSPTHSSLLSIHIKSCVGSSSQPGTLSWVLANTVVSTETSRPNIGFRVFWGSEYLSSNKCLVKNNLI